MSPNPSPPCPTCSPAPPRARGTTVIKVGALLAAIGAAACLGGFLVIMTIRTVDAFFIGLVGLYGGGALGVLGVVVLVIGLAWYAWTRPPRAGSLPIAQVVRFPDVPPT